MTPKITKNEIDECVPTTWKCSDKCKVLTNSEVDSIVKFKSGFDEPLREVRKLLDSCDECPNAHYHKILSAVEQTPLAVASAPRRGHSFTQAQSARACSGF